MTLDPSFVFRYRDPSRKCANAGNREWHGHGLEHDEPIFHDSVAV